MEEEFFGQTQEYRVRKRSENFSEYEKGVFLLFVDQFRHIIEDRHNDAWMIAYKEATWDKITSAFNALPGVTKRDRKQLRELWKRIKEKSKKPKAAKVTQLSSIKAPFGDKNWPAEKIAAVLSQKLDFLRGKDELNEEIVAEDATSSEPSVEDKKVVVEANIIPETLLDNEITCIIDVDGATEVPSSLHTVETTDLGSQDVDPSINVSSCAVSNSSDLLKNDFLMNTLSNLHTKSAETNNMVTINSLSPKRAKKELNSVNIPIYNSSTLESGNEKSCQGLTTTHYADTQFQQVLNASVENLKIVSWSDQMMEMVKKEHETRMRILDLEERTAQLRKRKLEHVFELQEEVLSLQKMKLEKELFGCESLRKNTRSSEDIQELHIVSEEVKDVTLLKHNTVS